ncbi:MAG: SpoIID/LytB domain-containing protein [candidate division WOR-3 bacterium]|nr:MAG: SpoIID/LytB domain-containing protein [candidate division WOR-3 bacterium]
MRLENKVDSRARILAIVMLITVNCMPYVGRVRRENLVRVAVECGVDAAVVSGVLGKGFYSDYRVTPEGSFPLILGPKDGRVAVNGRNYRGGLEVRKIDGRLWVINVLDIESYLKGVVPCEIGGINEKELEAAKAQAVAARTYALAHIGQYSDLGFDLYATVQDQVYKGIACEREMTNRVVESTAGEALYYRGTAVEAKYHSTCGGRTADFNDAWAGAAPPYLASVRCDYCRKSPHYRWTKVMTRDEFFAHLRRRLGRINIKLEEGELIHSFRMMRSKRSHRLKELILVTNKRELKIANYRIRTLFGEPDDPGGLLKSTCIFVKTKGDEVMIEGRGFGHGVGMCQFGALEMAVQGRNYRQILYHYYRGTRIKKVR